jgi:hypothetical protein
MSGNCIQTASVAGTSQSGFVSENAKRGELLGIAVAGGIEYHHVIIRLDGEQLASNYLSGIFGGPAHGNNSLTVCLPFERELVIEVRNSISSPQTVFWATYRIDGEAQDEGQEMIEFEEIEGVAHAYRRTDDSRVLLGPARSSHVVLTQDTWLPGESVTGYVELRTDVEPSLPLGDLPGAHFGVYDAEVGIPLNVRLAGRSRLFPLQRLEPYDNRAEFAIDYLSLAETLSVGYQFAGPPRFPGSPFLGLELVADVPGYANYPSSAF